MSNALLSLIIFGAFIIIFVWDKLPMATSAILGCVVMVISGVCNFETAFGQFASSTVVLLLGVMVVGSALTETGAAAKFGRLVTRLSGSNERVVIAVSYTIAALLSSFLTNATVLAIFMPIIVGMSAKDKRLNHMNIVLPVLTATAMGGISTLVGSSQQLTANGLLEEIGLGFQVFDFTPVGAILAVLGLLYSLFIGYPIGKKIWGGRSDEDCTIVAGEDIQADKTKLIIMSVIMGLMVISYIFVLVPPVITATSAALLCVITGCIPQKKAATQINWNIVGRLAACLGLAKAISKAGGIDLLSAWVSSIIGTNMSPFALFALVVLVTQALSLVISNSTAILITLPIIISISGTMGLNPQAFGMGIALASSMGICCPLSGSTNAMSMAAGYRFRDFFKYGILLDALCYVVIIVFVPMFFPLTV